MGGGKGLGPARAGAEAVGSPRMAKILVIGPHPDDQELGVGGSIAKFAAQGHDVLLLDVTNGEPTPHGTVEKREREAEAAAKILSPDPGRVPEGRPVRRAGAGAPHAEVETGPEA